MENYERILDADVVEQLGYEAAMLFVRAKWDRIMEEDFDNSLIKMENGTAHYPIPGKRNPKNRRHRSEDDRDGSPNDTHDELIGWLGV